MTRNNSEEKEARDGQHTSLVEAVVVKEGDDVVEVGDEFDVGLTARKSNTVSASANSVVAASRMDKFLSKLGLCTVWGQTTPTAAVGTEMMAHVAANGMQYEWNCNLPKIVGDNAATSGMDWDTYKHIALASSVSVATLNLMRLAYAFTHGAASWAQVATIGVSTLLDAGFSAVGLMVYVQANQQAERNIEDIQPSELACVQATAVTAARLATYSLFATGRVAARFFTTGNKSPSQEMPAQKQYLELSENDKAAVDKGVNFRRGGGQGF